MLCVLCHQGTHSYINAVAISMPLTHGGHCDVNGALRRVDSMGYPVSLALLS